MKIVFMGTMDFAVPILTALVEQYTVSLVVTQPDRPVGRKQHLTPTPVKEKALELGIPVFQPENIKTSYQEVIDQHADVIIVCAYGQMIPNIILQTPPFKAINVHASLLPKFRGGAPMHKAIQLGEEITGVSVMQMRQKMDSGPVYAQAEIAIELTDTVGSLQSKLAILGANLLIDTLPLIFNQQITPWEQDETKITYAWNIKPSEEHLNFHQTARQVYDHVRAFQPWPTTYAFLEGKKVKIHQVEMVAQDPKYYQGAKPGEIVKIIRHDVFVLVEDGLIQLKNVQWEGKKAMDIKDFMNGLGKDLFIIGKIFE